MTFNWWFVIVGALFIVMALSNSILRRLPLTTSLLYLLVGLVLGPVGLGLIRLDAIEQAGWLERITEVAVIISLFTSGLKLRTPLSQKRWQLPVRLAFVSMTVTVALIAGAGVFWLGLPLGAAILLGAVLAPTDPVLASDVQLEDPFDADRLRFSLTGEAGLNDGTAFPFVMLGLGLLGLHELGEGGWRWIAVDVLWATAAGLGVGWLCGLLVGRLVLYLRTRREEAVQLDDFLALGLIALSYGAALLVAGYGFLAVFAAGLALRSIELQAAGEKPSEDVQAVARQGAEKEVPPGSESAPLFMAQAVLEFNEQLERIGEVVVVVLVGGLLATFLPPPAALLWFVPLLFLVIRPISVWIGLLGSNTSGLQRRLMAWFGIRGIGSIYYLMFAITHGLPGDIARTLTAITLAVVAISIVVHGISVTPLMSLYSRRTEGKPA
ncbi:cation:proton antiporter [Gloeobacter morelensis]|uniref:Cation:proton antiporter n=1 Tax=Gloeobacter morelensis MG652769 TaxID=2781736 RepID=A0ABY3PR51_9CYAN|nr:cation:proton antiporter [Gloeobacter morelensis]UFP96191.1 cation:proton antiporter [Gloeobacter morelensis MG652769]